MDTVTLVRSAIRGLLKVADVKLEDELRGVVSRDDDYATAGKPVCDYDDPAAREALVDALARDARGLLGVLEGRELEPGVQKAAVLVATVVGQDLEEDADGVFGIVRRVAKDRVISTVDPEARHGHKTAARGFDGYKGHIAVDPDSEIITSTHATAGNTGDAEAAAHLLAADLLAADLPAKTDPAADDTDDTDDTDAVADAGEEPQERLAVYGDAAYGSGQLLAEFEAAGVEIMCKVQPASAPGGRFTKDEFAIDLAAGTVTCPGQHTTRIRPASAGGGTAVFGSVCASCPLAARCTSSSAGRTISIGAYEAELARARATQTDPAWRTEYRATRPKVERKLGHLMRRRHGGRRARVRGQTKVAADFSLLAAAANLARLGVLGLASSGPGNWVTATS
jgi:IS5 family transposase